MSKEIAAVMAVAIIVCALGVCAEAVSTVGFTVDEQILVDDLFNVSIWVDGVVGIDGVIIREMYWQPEMLEIVSIEPGWWDWLWDAGKLSDGCARMIQAGQMVKTTENQTAVTVTFRALKDGESIISFGDIQLCSGGPEVACISSDVSILVETTEEVVGEETSAVRTVCATGTRLSNPEEPVEEEPEEEPVEEPELPSTADEMDDEPIDEEGLTTSAVDDEKPFNFMFYLFAVVIIILGFLAFIVVRRMRRKKTISSLQPHQAETFEDDHRETTSTSPIWRNE